MEEKMGGTGSGKNEVAEESLDLCIRRTFNSSLAGAFAGFLLFRSPTARWASFAFGAGVGIGSAYTQCYSLSDTSPSPPPPPKLSDTPIKNVLDSD